jgi:uncharacterized protein YceH (UPF0502 family)
MEEQDFKVLDAVQIRVLGSLIEKALATPQYYPMTLNALVNACNQKTSRNPVTNFDERTVVQALDALNRHPLRLIGTVTGEGSRVVKYRHNTRIAFDLDEASVAALGVLFLRGTQTVGEIRNNVGSMYHYESFEQVEGIIQALSERQVPLVMALPRRAGQKEARFAHLLAGKPDLEAMNEFPHEPVRVQMQAENERITQLEAEVAALRSEIQNIKQALGME